MIINYLLFLCGFFIAVKISEKEKTENKKDFYSFSFVYYITGILIGLLPALFLNNFILNFILGMLIIQAFIDIKFMELSDKITIFILITFFIFVLSEKDFNKWKSVIIAAIICFTIYLLSHLISKGKFIGGGDVKISFILGLVGQYNLFQSIIFPLFVYIVYFTVTSFLKRNKNKKTREFFPSMLISFFVMAVFYNM